MCDSRDQQNTGPLQDSLTKLRLLSPKKFSNVDTDKGLHDVYGFVGQEVKTILPEAVALKNEAIPNIFEICSVSNATFILGKKGSVITLTDATTDTLLNKWIRLIDAKGDSIKELVSEVIDSKKFYISRIFDSSEIPQQTIKVYGTYVSDYHHIYKEHIWTLTAAAVQEIYEKISTLENTITAQSAAIVSLQTSVASLQNS